MKTQHLIALLQKDYTTIEVVFIKDERAPSTPSTGRHYTYKVKGPIKVGDTVVIHPGRYALATVVAVHDTPKINITAPFVYKWIVQVVNPTEHNKQVALDRSFAQALKEAERLQEQEALVKAMPVGSEALVKAIDEAMPVGSEARAIYDKALADFHNPDAVAPDDSTPKG